MELPEWAWASGVFEGEGYIFIGGRGQPGIGLGMCDEDIVRRFAAVVGVGNVTGPYAGQRAHHRPTWRWTSRSWADVAHVLIRMAPWLGERRRTKAAEVMRQRPLDSWLPGYTKRLQTECKRGHALVEGNVGADRRCLTCVRERRRRWLQTPNGQASRKRSRAKEKNRGTA